MALGTYYNRKIPVIFILVLFRQKLLLICKLELLDKPNAKYQYCRNQSSSERHN